MLFANIFNNFKDYTEVETIIGGEGGRNTYSIMWVGHKLWAVGRYFVGPDTRAVPWEMRRCSNVSLPIPYYLLHYWAAVSDSSPDKVTLILSAIRHSVGTLIFV